MYTYLYLYIEYGNSENINLFLYAKVKWLECSNGQLLKQMRIDSLVLGSNPAQVISESCFNSSLMNTNCDKIYEYII